MINQLVASFNFIIDTFGQECTITSHVDSSSIKLIGAFKNRFTNNLVEQVDFEERKIVIRKDDLNDFSIKNGDKLDIDDNQFFITQIEKHYIASVLVGYTLEVVE